MVQPLAGNYVTNDNQMMVMRDDQIKYPMGNDAHDGMRAEAHEMGIGLV